MEIAWGEALQEGARQECRTSVDGDVKRGNSLGRAPQEGATQDNVNLGKSLGGAPQDRSAGRGWMGCEAWK